MPIPPPISLRLDDVANTARVLRTLADQLVTQPPDLPSLAALLRQLAQDLEQDVSALTSALHDSTP